MRKVRGRAWRKIRQIPLRRKLWLSRIILVTSAAAQAKAVAKSIAAAVTVT